MAERKVPPFRLRNGTNVTMGDWIGYVVDQWGAEVWLTAPGGLRRVLRSQIVKEGCRYVLRGR